MVGGQAPKAIRNVECYDFEEDRWDQIAELPSRRCRAGESHGLPVCQLPPSPHSHAAGLCRVLKFCSLFLKTLCIPHSLPFPFPTCTLSSCTFWGQFLLLRDFRLL